MSILSINVNVSGLVGQTVNPRRNTMVTTSNLATITAAGFLNAQNSSGNIILPTDIFEVLYNFNPQTQVGTYGIFQVTYNQATGFQLVIWDNPGNVLLPVVAGDFAVFNGTTGQIADAGYLPTNAALTRIVMQSGASVIGDIPKYNDITGTLVDSGLLATNLMLLNVVQQMAAGSEIKLDKGTGTEAANAVTISKQSGVITTSALTVAAGSTYVITLTNTLIATSSVMLVSQMGGSNTTAGVSIRATALAGSSVITITNNNATSALNGTLIIGFAVL